MARKRESDRESRQRTRSRTRSGPRSRTRSRSRSNQDAYIIHNITLRRNQNYQFPDGRFQFIVIGDDGDYYFGRLDANGNIISITRMSRENLLNMEFIRPVINITG